MYKCKWVFLEANDIPFRWDSVPFPPVLFAPGLSQHRSTMADGEETDSWLINRWCSYAAFVRCQMSRVDLVSAADTAISCNCEPTGNKGEIRCLSCSFSFGMETQFFFLQSLYLPLKDLTGILLTFWVLMADIGLPTCDTFKPSTHLWQNAIWPQNPYVSSNQTVTYCNHVLAVLPFCLNTWHTFATASCNCRNDQIL